MALKGLVIRQPWIGMILKGEKTWEMRSTPCRHRGPVALIAKGSGEIVGLAQMVDDLPPLTEVELRSTFAKHRIPDELIGEARERGWVRPWVLTNVSQLARPVHYNHTSGGSWVNLSDTEEAAVYNQTSAKASSVVPLFQKNAVQNSKSAVVARQAISAMNQNYALGIASDASISISQKGRKLYIDLTWDDKSTSTPKKSKQSSWVDGIGLVSLGIACFCIVGFMCHFILGIMTEGINAASAFKWIIPLLGFSFLAGLCGQGNPLAKSGG